MYTEVKELVNFLAMHLLRVLPRRPASLFTCQLGNFLISRFREHEWDIEDPKKDEHYRVIHSKVEGFTDPLISLAATQMGLSAEEVLEYIPNNISLVANPGEVFYRTGDNATPVPIWTGEKGVDPDLTYCSLPAFITNPDHATVMLPPISNMSEFVCDVEDAYVPLTLEPIHPSNLNHVISSGPVLMFSYKPKHHALYRVEEFAATRFGSLRKRADNEKIRPIQGETASQEIVLNLHENSCENPKDYRNVTDATFPHHVAEEKHHSGNEETM